MHGLRIRLIGAGCIAAIVAIALMFVWVTAETTDVPADDAITHRVLTQGYIEDSGSGDPLAEATLSFHRPRTSSQKLVSLTSNADGWFDAIRLAEYTRDAYPDQLQCCFLPMRSSRWTVQYANSGQITDDLPYGLKGFPRQRKPRSFATGRPAHCRFRRRRVVKLSSMFVIQMEPHWTTGLSISSRPDRRSTTTTRCV